MTIYIGTTNTDGSGSAQNLNADNSFSPTFEYISGPLESQPEGTWVYGYVDELLSVTRTTEKYCVYCFSYHDEASNLSTWNAEDLKEIAIYNNEDGYVEINNFVDVCFVNDYYGTWDEHGHDGNQKLVINDAKRGYIDTRNLEGDPADEGSIGYGDTVVCSSNIIIAPHSNGDSWSNLFEVYTGLGSDKVTFTASQDDGSRDTSTQWTEFHVDLGEDNDTFTYDLTHSVSSGQLRYVDGGDDTDTLTLLVDTDDLDFENFEIITSNVVTLSLTANLLESNSSSEIGLIIDDTDVEFSADILDVSVSSLSDAQQDYLAELDFDSDEYSAITVTTEDGATYILLMNEVDDLIAA